VDDKVRMIEARQSELQGRVTVNEGEREGKSGSMIIH
jgi:hypothetical protein